VLQGAEFVMAIDFIAAVPAVTLGFDSSLLALRHQLQNESATSNLINDAVKQVQAPEACGDRQARERLLDIFV